MKKTIIYTMLIALVAIASSIITNVIYDIVTKDSKTVELEERAIEIADDWTSPSYDSPELFVEYAKKEADFNQFVNIVNNLCPETIEAIAADCIQKNEIVDPYLFLEEYIHNESTYLNVDAANKRKRLSVVMMESYNASEHNDTIEKKLKYESISHLI